jgi:hypothetical protein
MLCLDTACPVREENQVLDTTKAVIVSGWSIPGAMSHPDAVMENICVCVGRTGSIHAHDGSP